MQKYAAWIDNAPFFIWLIVQNYKKLYVDMEVTEKWVNVIE